MQLKEYTPKSSICWLDWDKDVQEKMGLLLKELQEPGTADDLGVRWIQIHISNRLFPGTSVNQTRLRYAILVIGLYLKLEKEVKKSKGMSLAGIQTRVRELECEIKDALKKDALEKKGGEVGIIGITSPFTVQANSSIIDFYKTLLRNWGFHSIDSDTKYFEKLLSQWRPKQGSKDDDKEVDEIANFWSLTQAQKQIIQNMSIDIQLDAYDAELLYHKLEHHHAHSLLGWLFSLAKNNQASAVALINCPHIPFEYEFWKEEYDFWNNLSTSLQDLVRYAQGFALLIKGATIVFHWCLCLELKSRYASIWDLHNREKEKAYDICCLENLDLWLLNWRDWYKSNSDFSISTLWDIFKIKEEKETKTFLHIWFTEIQKNNTAAELAAKTQQIIQEREKKKKPVRSYFRNEARLRAWVPITKGQTITYRWSNIQRFCQDYLDSQREKER